METGLEGVLDPGEGRVSHERRFRPTLSGFTTYLSGITDWQLMKILNHNIKGINPYSNINDNLIVTTKWLASVHPVDMLGLCRL